MKSKFYLLLFTLFPFTTSFSQTNRDTTSHPIRSIRITTNPVRAALDEISVFVEMPRDKPLTYGFSVGFIRPWRWIIDRSNFDATFDLSDHTILQSSSYGAVLRGILKWQLKTREDHGTYRAKNSKTRTTYLAVQPQYRLLFANRATIYDYRSFSSYSSTEASWLAHIIGVQAHIGWQSIHKRPLDEIYMGLGMNTKIATTRYHSYTNHFKQKTDLPERYQLKQGDTEVFFRPTFHVGYIASLGDLYQGKYQLNFSYL
jgi:hypothetical protein